MRRDQLNILEKLSKAFFPSELDRNGEEFAGMKTGQHIPGQGRVCVEAQRRNMGRVGNSWCQVQLEPHAWMESKQRVVYS